MAVHSYNHSTWEVETGTSRIQSQPGLHETVFENNNYVYMKKMCNFPVEKHMSLSRHLHLP